MFRLKTASTPYQIIYEKQRSYLPPHGEMKRPGSIDSATNEQVAAAVKTFLSGVASGFCWEEETEDRYIVTVPRDFELIILSVNKKTLEVKQIPAE